MTYDFQSPGKGHADISVTRPYLDIWGSYADDLDARGIAFSRKSIMSGIPFYGRVIGQPELGATYREIIAGGGSSFADRWENDGKTYGYTGRATVSEKTQYAIDNGFGGVMIWAIDQDLDPSDERSLLRCISETMKGISVHTIHEGISSNVNGITVGTMNAQEIRLSVPESGTYSISLFCLNGRKLFQLSSSIISGKMQSIALRNSIATGTYIMKVEGITVDKNTMSKIVVQ